MANIGTLEQDIQWSMNKFRQLVSLSDVERKLGYAFSDRMLLDIALTHSSAVASPKQETDKTYQRLEFLGDRILALVVADMLYVEFPRADEGELARRLTGLVRNETCVDVALELDLGSSIRLGESEVLGGGAHKTAILGDVCEAVIGAVHRDSGFDKARIFVEKFWRPRMINWVGPLRDAKTTLQEWAQGKHFSPPTYLEIDRSGPDHAPVFKIAVLINRKRIGEGMGNSKKAAEQKAAQEVLMKQGLWKQ